MSKLRSALSVLALVTTAALCQTAHAAFTYNVSPLTTSTNFGAGSNLTLSAAFNGAISSPLAGTQIINLAQVTQTSTTVSPATDTATIPFSLITTITNAGGSAPITMTGTLNVLRSDTQGAISTFSLTSFLPTPLVLGGFNYTLSSPTYAAPTIGAGTTANGSLSVMITETAIPEPASLGVLAMGGVALLARRRRQA